MEHSLIPIAYAIYLPIALLLTFFVAKALFKNAKTFMIDIFHGKTEIALATNRLFEIGFYLINVGFALLILRISDYGNDFTNYQVLIERLSYKIGGFSIYLGVMLFFNLYLLFRGRRKSNQKNEPTVYVGSKYMP